MLNTWLVSMEQYRGDNKMRTTKRTAVVSGEGSREAGMLEYLRTLYLVPDKYVRILNARGGSPSHQINEVMRGELSIRWYDEKYALFDTDYAKVKVVKAQACAVELGIATILSVPSVDYELVKLITLDRKLIEKAQKNTVAAKEVLAELCNLKRLNDMPDWKSYFPKELLDEERKNNKWLDDIIRIFE